MDQFMNEVAVWNMLSTAFISNAIFFAACAFLIWVGFRFTSRIYYEGNVNVLGKMFTTLFCLSVGAFTLFTMAQGAQLQSGTANAFEALALTQDISDNAQGLIDTSDGKLGPVQWVFLGSILVMQLTQIWTKKPE
ncbi:MAG: hypothetical protein CMD50_03910 [Gammaproteobacteria bacterium]|nr:hypothetical protein [Gammaproteobacteria bacterium]